MNDVTLILSRIESGDPTASEQLLPLVYEELRRLAAHRLSHERPGQTLQATALVHEAYLRLLGASGKGTSDAAPEHREAGWKSRAHFFSAAAEAMRRILIDLARRKGSLRRGAGRNGQQLLDGDLCVGPLGDALLDLDQALTRLAACDPQAAQAVTLRVFAGMTVEEIAEVQGMSPRTVKRNWAYARAWLASALADYDNDVS